MTRAELVIALRERAAEMTHESRFSNGMWTADLLERAATEIEESTRDFGEHAQSEVPV